jgi:hypothetical protein
MYVVLSLVPTLVCGYLNSLALADLLSLERLDYWAVSAVYLQVLALIAILFSAFEISRCRNRHLARAGCTVTLMLSTFQILVRALFLFAQVTPFGWRVPYAEEYWGVTFLLALGLGVIGWVGAVRGLILLHRPEVDRYFSIG